MTRPKDDETAPTDADIDALIARSETLLDELRATFAEIRRYCDPRPSDTAGRQP